MKIPSNLASDFEHCRRIALGHYENFPVGSILMPKRIRPHIYSLYAFMRTADDFADLPHRSSSERLALLAEWRIKLLQIESDVEADDPIFRALAFTVRSFDLDTTLLHKLLDAFEFDARGEVRFERFEDVRWYTERSAEPVGQLVLALFGYRDEQRIAWSNDICTALQLINFVQDVKEDLSQRRVYFPLEEFTYASENFVAEKLLDHKILSSVVGASVLRISRLLEQGSPLPASVQGRLKWELKVVVAMAKRMIEKIRKQGYNTLSSRPKLSRWEALWLSIRALLT